MSGNCHLASARGTGMEQAISRCCGCYVYESVQEQMGQVLAKIWALKAWLNQPIMRQVRVQVTNTNIRNVNRRVLEQQFSRLTQP